MFRTPVFYLRQYTSFWLLRGSLKMKQLFTIPRGIPSKPCSEKSESCAAVCTDTRQECIVPCSVKASCWYCTYSGTGEQEGIITVQAAAIQKILMTGARECHDRTGVFQGTDIEMHCPHVITDQILVACKKKVT